MLVKLFVVACFIVIVYNLGAGLYYLMHDKGRSDRMVRALSWRIGLSVGLILVVMLLIWLGVIRPHDLGR